MNDAWEAAKKIALNPCEGGLSIEELNEIFGCCTLQQVFRKYSASEVIVKLKTYEERRKVDEEIKIGDEVESLYNDRTVIEGMIPWVVTKIQEVDGKKYYYGIDVEGTPRNNDFVRKTDRHFDIDKILKEMKNKFWGVEF